MKTPPHALRRIIAMAAALVVAGSLATTVAAADDPLTQYESWDEKYKEYAYSICEEDELDYSLFIAIIYNESRFQADATHLNTNGTTDWGLMQINDVCYGFLSENCDIESMEELLNPYTAIRCGAAILKYHKDYTQNDSLALLRYQVGEGAYKRLIKNGITSTDTHAAVIKVADVYNQNHISSELMF